MAELDSRLIRMTVRHASMAPRFWAFTSALPITGLLDHRLLVTTMERTRGLAMERP
jgi:hypothetical protein